MAIPKRKLRIASQAQDSVLCLTAYYCFELNTISATQD